MNILMYLMSTPKPEGGGVSRMVYTVSKVLESFGHRIYYVAFEEIESRFDNPNISYFPSCSPRSRFNRSFLSDLIRKNSIALVINQIPLNKQFANLLYSIQRETAISIISVIHNASLNIYSNFVYRKEYQWEQNGKGFLFKIMNNTLTRCIIESLYICKHRTHYRRMEKYNDAIVAVSKSNIEDINRIIGFESRKVKCIPNCIEPPYNVSSIKEKMVVWCGKIETWRKRVDLMLDIWSIICQSHSDWILYIIGSGKVAEMSAYADRIGAQNVIFTGEVNPSDYYRRASIICHTSISESFGLVIAEAMSYGAVPIAFDSYPACKDVIPDNVGFRIPKVSRELFGESLAYLMDNPNILSDYSSRAQSFVQRYYVNNIKQKWAELIDSI